MNSFFFFWFPPGPCGRIAKVVSKPVSPDKSERMEREKKKEIIARLDECAQNLIHV